MACTTVDPRAAEITTLRRAVEFSKGLRYTLEEAKNCCEVDAIGLDAYQLWLDVLAGGEFDGSEAKSHAWQLMHTRQLAAEYTREAVTRFEGAVSARLMTASVNYLQESEVARQLLETVTPCSKAPTPSQVEEAPVKVGVDVVPTEPHRGTTPAMPCACARAVASMRVAACNEKPREA